MLNNPIAAVPVKGGGGAVTPDPLQNMFGRVAPPGSQNLADPGTGFSKLLGSGIQLTFTIGGLMLLFYLFYGAFLYITSGGEEEKVTKARNTMTYAVFGIVFLIVGLGLFIVIAGNVLHIVDFNGGGFILKIPTVGN